MINRQASNTLARVKPTRGVSWLTQRAGVRAYSNGDPSGFVPYIPDNPDPGTERPVPPTGPGRIVKPGEIDMTSLPIAPHTGFKKMYEDLTGKPYPGGMGTFTEARALQATQGGGAGAKMAAADAGGGGAMATGGVGTQTAGLDLSGGGPLSGIAGPLIFVGIGVLVIMLVK